MEYDERIKTTVFEMFKRAGKPIMEDHFHLVNQALDLEGRGIGFEYELVDMNTIDKKFNSKLGAILYSSKLHKVIEELVNNRDLKRNPENPLELECSAKIMSFSS